MSDRKEREKFSGGSRASAPGRFSLFSSTCERQGQPSNPFQFRSRAQNASTRPSTLKDPFIRLRVLPIDRSFQRTTHECSINTDNSGKLESPRVNSAAPASALLPLQRRSITDAPPLEGKEGVSRVFARQCLQPYDHSFYTSKSSSIEVRWSLLGYVLMKLDYFWV